MLPSVRAMTNTAQSFAPPNSAGAGPMVWEFNRSPYLPPRGTKQRDLALRWIDRNDDNMLWQGATSGIIKKISTVSFTVTGKQAQYYQDMLGYAHFGHGWEYLLKLILRDYLTQSYGAIFEIAGPGEPDTQLIEAPTGINHLDAGRCYVTGNPIYPLLYYSLWDGKLHKMHASRVYMMVDDPDPDERYLGIGRCALERYITVAQREILMAQYVNAMLDDKPQPGLLALSGIALPAWETLVSRYMQEQSNNERPVFGKTLVMTSVDPNAPVKAEVIPFSQTPEKFDFIKYTDEDVSALALALGVDRQELWELAGRGLGSGSQSAVLAMKSRAKLYGDMLTSLERFMNWAILPDDCEFTFIEHDSQTDVAQTAIDVQLATLAQTLSQIPGISPLEIKRMLVHRSDTFKDAMTDENGEISVPSEDPKTPAQLVQQEPELSGDTPVQGGAPAPNNPQGLIPANATSAARAQMKAFSSTAADFRTGFESVLDRATEGTIRRNQAESIALSLLVSSGEKAYADGLRQGGVDEPLDDEELGTIQVWAIEQIDYLDPLLDAAFGKALSSDQIVQRADMWVNKALGQMFNAGRLSADANGMYEFVGNDGRESCPTCKRLKGQIHRFKDWDRKQLIPGVYTDTFDCGGWQCLHRLKRVKAKAQGNW
jgi:hypothetical protein